VKLSSAAAGKDTPFSMPSSPIAQVHQQVEDYLKASGIGWTILQPNGFMQNWLGEFSQRIKDTRRIEEATGDGKRAYIDLRDIAEVAFATLTAPDVHAGHSYVLTGGEAVNYGQVAAIVEAVVGEPVTYHALTLAEAQQRMEKRGLPPAAVQTFVSYATAQRAGAAAYVSNDVPEILRKPARSVASFVHDYSSWFK